MRQIQNFVLCLFVAALVLTAAGCGPQSPEEQVAATRAQYSAKLESFSIVEPEPEPPPAEEMMAEGEEGMAAAEATAVAAEAAAEGEEMAEEGAEEMEEMAMEEMAMESGPRTVDVILHMLVRFSGEQALPGITVEVTQADASGTEKEPTLHWIETAGMTKSDVQQVDLRLEGVEYEDGDAFSVLLRENVPAAEHGRYREFAEAGSS